MAKLVYSGSLLVDLFNRPLKKLVDSAHCRCTGHWNDKHLTVPPTQRGKKNTSKKQNGEKELCRVTGEVRQGGCTEKYLKVGKEEKRKEEKKSENSKEICEALKINVFLLISYTYFWSTELHLESTREGQVDEGVRVALLKLDTDGSRPIGEISESCKHKHRKSITGIGL